MSNMLFSVLFRQFFVVSIKSDSPKAMPICLRWIGRIGTEKAARRDGKLRKMSIGVQIWTRLEESSNANLTAGARQVEKRFCAQFIAAGSYASIRS